MEMMLDSGLAVSLVIKQEVANVQLQLTNSPVPKVKLITALKEPLPITGCVHAFVQIHHLEVSHQFLFVERLVAPVIFGLDFMQQHNIVLNFASRPVTISNHTEIIKQMPEVIPEELQLMLDATHQLKSKVCVIAAIEKPANNVIDNCAIPDFQSITTLKMPECTSILNSILEQYKQFFIRKAGKAEGTYHHIPTFDSPVKISPRCIPAHYKEEVESQIQSMLANHIIEESSSSWMSPAVFVKKKTGDVRLCIDYTEQTTCDAYPLPLPDEV